MHVILVGCVKTKRPGEHRAKDLYDSPLFVGRRGYAEANADRWFILSAKYGLLRPDEVVPWYEQSIQRLSRQQRREWSERTLAALDAELGDLGGHTFEVHAGSEYLKWGLLDGLTARGAPVHLPLTGLPLGNQLRWYRQSGY